MCFNRDHLLCGVFLLDWHEVEGPFLQKILSENKIVGDLKNMLAIKSNHCDDMFIAIFIMKDWHFMDHFTHSTKVGAKLQ